MEDNTMGGQCHYNQQDVGKMYVNICTHTCVYVHMYAYLVPCSFLMPIMVEKQEFRLCLYRSVISIKPKVTVNATFI